MQRDALIETGVRLIHERGYMATGVREIAAAAKVPQGSFTNHFRSKEAFAGLALQQYFASLEATMLDTLCDVRLEPSQRLFAYFDAIENKLGAADWRTGCLVADMAVEVPMHSEVLRERLCEVIERQAGYFEATLREIAASKSDGDAARAEDLGSFILAAWYGTLLRMKTERDPAAVHRFRRVVARLVE